MKSVTEIMPSIVTLFILSLFSFVIIHAVLATGNVTDPLLQTLVSIVMLGVGFWLGSSSDSRKKTDALSDAATAPPPAAVAVATTEAAH